MFIFVTQNIINLNRIKMDIKATLTNLQPYMATVAAVGVAFLVYKHFAK